MFSPTLNLNSVDYRLITERRGGNAIYEANDKSNYLRIGRKFEIEKELSFHKKLLELNFPVAEILKIGKIDKFEYWIEESLGDTHFSEIFSNDFVKYNSITISNFENFYEIIKKFHDAQEKTITLENYDWNALYQSVGYNDIVNELSDNNDLHNLAWEKVKNELKSFPQCLTQGDFTTHNVMPGGVIDFGDHFLGPVGYDIVTMISTPFWFPSDKSFELWKGYDFSEENISDIIKVCRFYNIYNQSVDVMEKFNTLFFLRSVWYTVRMHKMPKLQAWRYKKYKEILTDYINGRSLVEYIM